MAILHTVNKSAFTHTLLDQCLRIAGPGDVVVLLEDGVFATLRSDQNQQRIKQLSARIVALKPDLAARGIVDPIAEINLIDYREFVRLSVDFDTIQNWF